MQRNCKISALTLQDPCKNQTLILQDGFKTCKNFARFQRLSYKTEDYLARSLHIRRLSCKILQESCKSLVTLRIIFQDLVRFLQDLARPCKIAVRYALSQMSIWFCVQNNSILLQNKNGFKIGFVSRNYLDLSVHISAQPWGFSRWGYLISSRLLTGLYDLLVCCT